MTEALSKDSDENLAGFDPYSIFHVPPPVCHKVKVTVLHGHDFTRGSWLKDKIDTPDPYLILTIPQSVSSTCKTTVCVNNCNPDWNEHFEFLIRPSDECTLVLKLMDSDIIHDNLIDTKSYDLLDVEMDKPTEVIVTFLKKSKLYLEILRSECDNPSIRCGLTLCDEEKQFVCNRKKHVFEVMKEVFGDEGPQCISEVPVIGILGSGGGIRALSGFSGVMLSLQQTRIAEMATYVAGVSGSACYLGYMFSHPPFPDNDDLKRRVSIRPKDCITIDFMKRFVADMREKLKRKEIFSITDVFGQALGDILFPNRSLLSEQAAKITGAELPMPFYNCIRVAEDVPATTFYEWVEFSPYEVTMPKYGVSIIPQLFNSRFILGYLLEQHPEPPLCYLAGIWGSFYTFVASKPKNKQLADGPNSMEPSTTSLGGILKNQEDYLDKVMKHCTSSTEPKTITDQANHVEGEIREKERDQSSTFNLPPYLVNMFAKRKGRAAQVLNFLSGLSLKNMHGFSPFQQTDCTDGPDLPGSTEELIPQDRHLYMVDAGLALNLPFPPLLRPQRHVDLLFSFDFSTRENDDSFPFKALLASETWAKEHKIQFPPITVTKESVKREGIKELYIFRDPNEEHCPIVVHFVLINDTFRKFKSPGVERETAEEHEFANFSIFGDGEKSGSFPTMKFDYTVYDYERISALTAYNTLNHMDEIKSVIIECINRRRKFSKAANQCWEIAGTMKQMTKKSAFKLPNAWAKVWDTKRDLYDHITSNFKKN